MLIDRAWRAGVAAAALHVLLWSAAAAQETPASPGPGEPPGTVRLDPPPATFDSTPRQVVVPGRPSDKRDSVGGTRLKGWRAQSLVDGEGRLLVDGASLHVKPGDTISGYVVKGVGPRRVVLED